MMLIWRTNDIKLHINLIKRNYISSFRIISA